MMWFPAASADVVKVATPPLSVPVPSVLAPSLKVTVPVAVPVAAVAVAAHPAGLRRGRGCENQAKAQDRRHAQKEPMHF